MSTRLEKRLYTTLVGREDAGGCEDIPEEACAEQAGNFLKHVVALTATKTGDGLADPKLVLSWLLIALGAPEFLIGFLVPVREAGSLVPQLAIAGAIRSLPKRKWVWAAGSAAQGLAVLGMAAAAFSFEGATAGWSVLGLLAVFAVARSVCSVTYKDVLGKTVSKTTRGTATGTAASAAAAAVLTYGALLTFGALPKTTAVIAGGMALGGALWLAAALVFATLAETAGDGGSGLRGVLRQLELLREDPQLVRFIAVRALLLATALAPPYIVAASGYGQGGLGELGPFVLASSLASVSSGFFWGRLSDASSRKVLMLAGLVAAGALGAAAIAVRLGASTYPLAGVLFVLMTAYQGVRIGRSTHIVDMASEDTRASYVALANTIIGVLLMAGAAFGWLAQQGGAEAVLGAFALMCVGAAAGARGLEEVQV